MYIHISILIYIHIYTYSYTSARAQETQRTQTRHERVSRHWDKGRQIVANFFNFFSKTKSAFVQSGTSPCPRAPTMHTQCASSSSTCNSCNPCILAVPQVPAELTFDFFFPLPALTRTARPLKVVGPVMTRGWGAGRKEVGARRRKRCVTQRRSSLVCVPTILCSTVL